MMTMLDRFGADINKAFLAKRKRLETFTKSSVKTSHQKIEQLWRVQQRDRSKVTVDYCTQFNAVFSQWDTDVQKSEDNEEKLLSMFQHQQKMFKHKRASQSQRLKTLKQLLEQYIQVYIQVYYLIVFFNMVILNLCLSWFSHATLFCWAGALIRWRRPMSASRVLHRASCTRRWHCFRKRFSVTHNSKRWLQCASLCRMQGAEKNQLHRNACCVYISLSWVACSTLVYGCVSDITLQFPDKC
uniref:uncharacterized protein LOC124004079 isoform X1 n=1 Tax=Oncorhynchus gorbuscha TaxID=8017 RepID=UPI001EAEA9AC|nr:uncharacterized protein LOC124004079 isoform X1 [Oncorhynchus gorbuscha]